MKERTKKYLKIFGVMSLVFGCVFGLSVNAIGHNTTKVKADTIDNTETNTIIDLTNNNDIAFLDKDIYLRADIEILGVGNNFRYNYDFTSERKDSFITFLRFLTEPTAYQFYILEQNALRENFTIYYNGVYYDFSYISWAGPSNYELKTAYFLTKDEYYNGYDAVNFQGLYIDMSMLEMEGVDIELYYYCDYRTYTTPYSYVTLYCDLYDNTGDFSYYIPPYLTLSVNETFSMFMRMNNINGNIIQGVHKTRDSFGFNGNIFYDLQNQGLNTKGDKYIVEVVGINNTTSIGNTLLSYAPVYSYDETQFFVSFLTYNSLLFLQKYCVPSWVSEYQSEMYFNERKLYRFGTQYPVFRGNVGDNPWVGTALDYLHDNVYGTFNNFTFEYGGKYYDNIDILAPVSWSYLNGNQYEWYIRAGNQFIQYDDIIVTMKMVEDSFEITGEYDYLSGQSLTYKGAYTEQIYNFMVLFGFVDNNIGPSIGIGNTGGTFTDIFDVFGSAFNGVYNAFSVYVLPGVTLWALCMIPLVAIIILFIVKLFKR